MTEFESELLTLIESIEASLRSIKETIDSIAKGENPKDEDRLATVHTLMSKFRGGDEN
jgi:hypothetical protein